MMTSVVVIHLAGARMVEQGAVVMIEQGLVCVLDIWRETRDDSELARASLADADEEWP